MNQSTFTERVYDVVRQIPAGKVMTYTEVAIQAGSPRAARAVGQIMKRNQHSFLTVPSYRATPCHRVVAADYRIGGFNAGQEAKITLLEQEGWIVENSGTLTKISPSPSLRKRGVPSFHKGGLGRIFGLESQSA